MELLQQIVNVLWPPLSILLIGLLLAWLSHWVAQRSQTGTSGLLYQLFIWFNASVVIIAIIILLPLSDDTQGQILSLLGVVLTAVIALSSTTFVSNAIAGIMLQATRPFRPGDYIRVNQEFGRVTRRSLIHTQIQTEWRDLTTLPNLMLINNPVTVLHREGTIIYAELSIGYDVTYTRVEELLLIAGAEAGLEEPFLLVHELLDHAVAYRICGFLPSMNNLLSSRSNLRKTVLEQMHSHGIEIVSPGFMNQRQLDPASKIIPAQPVLHDHDKPEKASLAPEAKIFDKAVEAASIEELKESLEETRASLKRERQALKEASEGARQGIERQIAALEQQEHWRTQLIEQKTNKE